MTELAYAMHCQILYDVTPAYLQLPAIVSATIMLEQSLNPIIIAPSPIKYLFEAWLPTYIIPVEIIKRVLIAI